MFYFVFWVLCSVTERDALGSGAEVFSVSEYGAGVMPKGYGLPETLFTMLSDSSLI